MPRDEADPRVVMGLGIRLLWNLQITFREKIALGAIFSVGLIKITFAIIRVVKLGPSAAHVNPIWLAQWSMIEASVAVVVACLPSFRVPFAHGRRQSENRRAVSLRRLKRPWSRSQSDELIRSLENGGWGTSAMTHAQVASAEEGGVINDGHTGSDHEQRDSRTRS